jgi:hypothetical protein
MAYYPADIRENVLTNNCDFDILRFQRNEIMCIDYGIHKKFCNHYALNKEFLVTLVNEKNLMSFPG